MLILIVIYGYLTQCFKLFGNIFLNRIFLLFLFEKHYKKSYCEKIQILIDGKIQIKIKTGDLISCFYITVYF